MKLARSGWIPAALTVVAVAIALLTNNITVNEVVRFAAYCLFGLVLPGLVLWRLLVPTDRSTLLADAVFGASLALAVELFVYAACAHVDHPGVAWVWPVVAFALAFVPRWRNRVWRRSEAQPLWWSWGTGGLLVMALLVLREVAWSVAPLTANALRSPYVDIPYHLSLVTGLSKHVKTDLPFVEGEPLYYHWFDHAHLAAERHATGIDPIVLLNRLDMVVIVAIVLLGSAMLAQRVARSPLAGLVALGVLTLGGTALIWPHFTPLFLNTSTYISPTTAFACAVLVGCAAVSVELLDPDDRPPLTAWVAAVLLIGASSGAKGTALPVLIAGWIAVIVMGLLIRRRVHWAALGLAAFGLVVFEIAQKVIYGGSAQGTGLVPFGLGNYLAHDYGLLDQPAGGSLGLRGTVTMMYTLIRLSCLVAIAGLFTPRVWRHPHAHFLVGSIAGGLGALLLLDSATRNQVYFLLVTPVFVATVTGWGLVELLRRVPTRVVAARFCVGFLVVGMVLSGVLIWSRPAAFGGDDGVSLPTLLRQPLIVLGVLVLVGVVLSILGRRRAGRPWLHVAPLACASLAIGLGLLTGPLHALDIDYLPAAEIPSKSVVPEIAPGGIDAARWLRDHSSQDAIVATNSHCRFPAPRRCDHRAFWISAYSERQVLLEGWAYTSESSALAAKEHVSVPFLPYWKPRVLRSNDLAFSRPTRRRLEKLEREHVTYLFADRRYPVKVHRLRKLADLVHSTKDYAIFRLP
jgi:hypothetical protein